LKGVSSFEARPENVPVVVEHAVFLCSSAEVAAAHSLGTSSLGLSQKAEWSIGGVLLRWKRKPS